MKVFDLTYFIFFAIFVQLYTSAFFIVYKEKIESILFQRNKKN